METFERTYSLRNYSKFRNSRVITRPIWIPCASWRWLGKKQIHSVSVLDDEARFAKRYWDDSVVIKKLHSLMEEADVIVAHNGDKFDWKILKARVIAHGLPPMPEVRKVDTLKMARSEFGFEANDLRYLAWYMGLAEKGQTPDWDLIAVGDVKELKKCLKYNREDIPPLEGIFSRLLPHTKIKLFGGKEECPVCGGKKYQSRGVRNGKRRFVCITDGCRKAWSVKEKGRK